MTHLNPEGMHRNPAYSQGVVVEATARTVYVGGQNAVSPEGQVVGVGDLAAQTERPCRISPPSSPRRAPACRTW